MLAEIATGLAIANSAKSLFGGSGKSQSDMMEEQVGWNYQQAEYLPGFQVAGLRRAGLNPMLAYTKGLPAGQMPTQNAQDDRSISTARQLATAQIANQAAQAQLYSAQAENVRAQTQTELKRPENVDTDTALKKSSAMQAEALEVLAKNQGLYVAAQEVQQTLLNQINASTLAPRIKAELANIVNHVSVSSADAARAKTDQRFYESQIGEILRTVERVKDAINPFGGSSAKVRAK